MNRTNPRDGPAGANINPPSSFEGVEPRNDGVQPGRSPPPYRDRNPPPYTCDSKLAQQYHLKHYFELIIAKLAFPVALLAGSGITAGTTYALVAHVLHLIRYATVSSDPQVWMHQAKIKDYDPCYDGCEECVDPEYSYTACLRTAAIDSGDPNVTCDGTKIWFWLYRYPPACLSVRGEYYRNIALEELKRNYKNQLAVLLPTIIGGLVGGVIVYGLWKCCTFQMKQRAEVRESNWPGWRRRERRMHRYRHFKKATIGLLTVLLGRTAARICVGHDHKANELLISDDESLWVHVHSSFSECHDHNECERYWGCDGSSCKDAHHLKCDPCTDASCQPPPAELCFDRAHVPRTSQDFVNEILPEIMHCGFRLKEHLWPFRRVRLPNPGFEMNWFVRVEVSGYNETNPRELNKEIICLHSIGDRKPPTNRTDWLTDPDLIPRPPSIGTIPSLRC